jgi:acyl-CoA reductase-like NAD-dependent aldehyde dehydrogenase
MELGGKNPLVVFDDADQREALLAAVQGGFFNQGETRASSSRILVQRNILGEFEGRLGAAVRRLRVGDSADPATDVGPLVTRAQQQQVLDHVSAGVSEGARIAAQAPLPDDPRLADGFFVPPTVLTDVSPRMRVAREAILGPVVVLIPFDDEDEAVRIANGTRFGLAAAVFTRDGDRALRVSRRMRAKTVFVNRGVGPGACVGENTRQTLAEYGYTKTIRLAGNRDERPHLRAAARALEG